MANMNIPSEMITKIMYHLPAKSLGRFRCVSKEWLSLISDPKFIKTHSKTTHRNHIIFSDPGLLYSHPFNRHESLLTPTKFHLQSDLSYVLHYNVCGSCDGLVLVSIKYYGRNRDPFVLYNPTTRDFVELPVMYDQSEDDDWSPYETMKGFGYDSVNDDYKVLTIAYCRRWIAGTNTAKKGVFVHVYSLGTNTWKLLTDYAYDYSFVDYSYHYMEDNWSCVDMSYGYTFVFVNGFLHWIAKKNSNGLHVIMAFSLADETFSEVPSPNLCRHDDVHFISNTACRLFALGGKLAIFVEGVVWLMNEYGKGESWSRIRLYRPDKIQMDRPKVFDDNGRVLIADKDRMLVYYVEKGRFSKTIYVWNLKKFWPEGTCVESLVSPKFRKVSKKRTARQQGKPVKKTYENKYITSECK